jgi:putative hydrolase of the HAD superfamily
MSAGVEGRAVRAIAFDLGGVLLRDEFSDLIRRRAMRLLGCHASAVRAAMRDVARMQCGRETSVQFWHRVCRHLRIEAPPDADLQAIFCAGYDGHMPLNRPVLQLVRKLRTRYPLALISNTIAEHREVDRRRGIFELFDTLVLSYEVGCRKPQARIFRLAARRLGVRTANLLFIDDNPEFVAAARRCGIISICYRSPEGLLRTLQRARVSW